MKKHLRKFLFWVKSWGCRLSDHDYGVFIDSASITYGVGSCPGWVGCMRCSKQWEAGMEGDHPHTDGFYRVLGRVEQNQRD